MNARFLAHWLTTAAALGVTAWLLPGVEVTSLAALAVATSVHAFAGGAGGAALLAASAAMGAAAMVTTRAAVL